MAKKKAYPAAHLPKKAPRKSGKKGIGPREVEGDLVAQDTARQAAVQPPTEPQGEILETPSTPKPKRGRPRQTELPGMEDKHLEDLENMARDYAGVRDERMALNRTESDLKEKLLALMKKHDKKMYRVEEMEIRVVVTEEKVKVRILEEKEE
jgi:hypothetical protein